MKSFRLISKSLLYCKISTCFKSILASSFEMNSSAFSALLLAFFALCVYLGLLEFIRLIIIQFSIYLLWQKSCGKLWPIYVSICKIILWCSMCLLFFVFGGVHKLRWQVLGFIWTPTTYVDTFYLRNHPYITSAHV